MGGASPHNALHSLSSYACIQLGKISSSPQFCHALFSSVYYEATLYLLAQNY